MKILTIVIVLILIGGGWYLYTHNTHSPSSETMTEESGENTADDSSTTQNDQTGVQEDTSGQATDAGMEFPTVDSNGSASADAETKTFDITGHNYAFSTKEIRVKEGDTVTINFSSTDGFHDWTIDEFNAHTSRVNTGESSSITFVANKKGTFEYYCSVGSHRALGMVGTLIVE